MANRVASRKTLSSATVNTVAVAGTGAALRRDATAFRPRLPASMMRGRAPKPVPQVAADADDGAGHLPAFLLRPVRIKA